MKNTGKYLVNLTMETLNMYDVEFIDAEQYVENPIEVDDDSIVVVPQLSSFGAIVRYAVYKKKFTAGSLPYDKAARVVYKKEFRDNCNGILIIHRDVVKTVNLPNDNEEEDVLYYVVDKDVKLANMDHGKLVYPVDPLYDSNGVKFGYGGFSI